jgi:hypothetical protein
VARAVLNFVEGVVMEVPLTVGVAGALLVPTLVAIGAIGAVAAVAGHYTLVVERRTPPDATPPPAAIAGESAPPA